MTSRRVKALESENITNLKKFAYWLTRESGRKDCQFSGFDKYKKVDEKQALKILKQCPNLEDYYQIFRRDRKELGQMFPPRKCDERALEDTKDFINHFTENRARLGRGGARYFCALASEYLKRPGWGFEECASAFEGKSGRGYSTPAETILRHFTEDDREAICENVYGLRERMKLLNDQIVDIEGDEASNHARVQYLNDIKERRILPPLLGKDSSGRRKRTSVSPPPRRVSPPSFVNEDLLTPRRGPFVSVPSSGRSTKTTPKEFRETFTRGSSIEPIIPREKSRLPSRSLTRPILRSAPKSPPRSSSRLPSRSSARRSSPSQRKTGLYRDQSLDFKEEKDNKGSKGSGARRRSANLFDTLSSDLSELTDDEMLRLPLPQPPNFLLKPAYRSKPTSSSIRGSPRGRSFSTSSRTPTKTEAEQIVGDERYAKELSKRDASPKSASSEEEEPYVDSSLFSR